jgi:predicted component of type VI protein secretion system
MTGLIVDTPQERKSWAGEQAHNIYQALKHWSSGMNHLNIDSTVKARLEIEHLYGVNAIGEIFLLVLWHL